MKRFKLKKRAIISLLFIMCGISSSTVLATYVSSIQGNTTTSIANWNVSIDTTSNAGDTVNINSGTAASYVVDVISDSGVAVNYTIVLSNVPDNLEVKLDNGSYVTPTNNEITFSGANLSFAAGSSSTHSHTLTFNDPISTTNNGSYSVDIDVIFVQAD